MPDFKWQLPSFNFNHLGPLSLFACAAIAESAFFKNVLTRFGLIDNNMATKPLLKDINNMSDKNTAKEKEEKDFKQYQETIAVYTAAKGTLTLPDGKPVIVTKRTDPNRNLGI